MNLQVTKDMKQHYFFDNIGKHTYTITVNNYDRIKIEPGRTIEAISEKGTTNVTYKKNNVIDQEVHQNYSGNTDVLPTASRFIPHWV